MGVKYVFFWIAEDVCTGNAIQPGKDLDVMTKTAEHKLLLFDFVLAVLKVGYGMALTVLVVAFLLPLLTALW